MKIEPRYGYYPWWPQNGDDWVHPEDVALARRLIPSPRVFRREGGSGPYARLRYGDVCLRVKPTLWQEVASEGLEMGDWVEVLSRMRANDPRTGVVCEIHWDDRARGLRYQVRDNDRAIPNWFSAEDLRPLDPPSPRESVRIEPQDEADDDWLV